ncbi:GNAT family N-acetyltransferase [Agriterribacter sp.]|uniref:GNAT family N-acetyltransferase n=1 Tax=Agriterribacter sp. TaxID=2821509 RepID=UPI002CE4C109|nr:GNAT family N-acetyltransferase [Agriterribacter sp.]HRO46713.1 GNAT family N-acetyltransferase [Agriterribacter sp.]HRQ18901.1 GNAT family N-acetyltransferase [Agriterribacter sp.]
MITILPYQPGYQPYFEKLNKAWLEKYFTIEPVDEYLLGNPEEAILKEGGKILFASYNGTIAGTVALKHAGNEAVEMIKMAVDESFRGLGIGRRLCEAAIDAAREMNAKKIVLYSEHSLKTALAIYRQYGFIHKPADRTKYKRADVYMELDL